MSQLIGSLATDVVKIGVATGASIAAASGIVTLGFTVAVGPIAAVVLVGVVTSMTLGSLDEHYGITDRVIVGLDNIGQGVDGKIERAKDGFYKKAGDLADSVFDYAVDSAKAILIDAGRHAIDRFLSGRPRLR